MSSRTTCSAYRRSGRKVAGQTTFNIVGRLSGAPRIWQTAPSCGSRRRLCRTLSPVRYETLRDLRDFAAVAPDWDRLVHAMPRPSPFLLHGWLLAWWSEYQRYGELAVEAAFDEEGLVGAIPVYVDTRYPIRVARFLGGPDTALADVLTDPRADAGLVDELAARLRDGSQHIVTLAGMPLESKLAAALQPTLKVVERVEAPVLDLSGGWEAAYRRKTNARRRNLHSRRRKQLAALGRLEIVLARTETELDRALTDAFQLHRLRWRGRADRSLFGDIRGQVFHRAALRAIAPQDVARILTLKLDGRPIAFHYYFVIGKTMCVHRLAFDPAFARFSPGLVNTLLAIEAAAAEGVTRVEYLGGGERYKLEFADGVEPLGEGIGLPSNLAAAALVKARTHAIQLRRQLKRNPRVRRFYLTAVGRARGAFWR
jgi:CelD/BcsL family acetyltransferase involved in cellulose biosynthesis